jgi:hypothetical protein
VSDTTLGVHTITLAPRQTPPSRGRELTIWVSDTEIAALEAARDEKNYRQRQLVARCPSFAPVTVYTLADTAELLLAEILKGK